MATKVKNSGTHTIYIVQGICFAPFYLLPIIVLVPHWRGLYLRLEQDLVKLASKVVSLLQFAQCIEESNAVVGVVAAVVEVRVFHIELIQHLLHTDDVGVVAKVLESPVGLP